MKSAIIGALGALMLGTAGAASAATINFGGVSTSSFSLEGGLLTMSVAAYTYQEASPIALTAAAVTYSTNGLGVNSGPGDPKLASADSEMLVFTFSAPVDITAITFWNDDTNDYVDLVFGTSASVLSLAQDNILTSAVNSYLLTDLSQWVGFGVGANDGNSDQIRIKSLDYTVTFGGDNNQAPSVPVPAAGGLLLGALAGLGALRHRRKSA